MSIQPAPYYKSPSGKQATYYFAAWGVYGRNYLVKNLPIDKITDVAYAFFNIDASGKIYSGDSWADLENPFVGKGVDPQNTWESPKSDLGNLGQFRKLIKAGKKFNMTLSIGGWTWSKYFSSAVSTDTTRRNIVSSISSIFQTYPGLFNGISWDWEYLTDNGENYGNAGNEASRNDVNNFIELIKLCKTTLPGFRHSICVVAAPEKVACPWETLHPYVDEVHIMSYDFSDGSWGEKVTSHHTNPRKSSFGKWSVEQAADYYLSRKIPSTKLFIGGACYSRGFSNTDGFGKAASGGSPDFEFAEEKGVVPYHMLPRPGATEYVDPESKGAYSYDPVKKVVNTYDNPESIKEKCKIIFEKNLGGIIFWESAGDIRDVNNPRSLMKTVHENLTHKSGSTGVVPTPAPAPKPVPTPTPAPTPAAKTYSCDFCSVCTKTSNISCKSRTTVTPTPGPSSPTSSNTWAVGKGYKKGDVVEYSGKKYQCLLGHTSMAMWAPPLAEKLWQQLV